MADDNGNLVTISVPMYPDDLEKIEKYIAEQIVKPSRSAVIRAAIRHFLKGEMK